MTSTQISPEDGVTLEDLVKEIKFFENTVLEWHDPEKLLVVEGLKQSIEALHKEALTRLIRSVKQESLSALRHAVEDEVVYGILRYHELVKPPQPPLETRIQQALEEVRPGLKSHSGDVELVAIKLPDTVEVKLVGTCSNCPASTLTLKQGVEQAIKNHCPEIQQVISVNTPVSTNNSHSIISPFSADNEAGWVAITTIEEIPDGGILAVELDGLKLIITQFADKIQAYRNSCTHLAMPLDKGKIQDGILTCPFHHFQYNLTTGDCLTAPEMPLQPYPVKQVGERVLVRV
ncbi:rieske domain protein [Lyngbya aestuarii BL J]|uniref:Rieske domain protein n=1 Tax=Lyngbya aestuarii BL J TaxID=1348334 RepID=U7QA19_9CYAN|nr:NifU family protein [Lyngbya aestuarii]ERT04668.1 rieske domain protein [Lyngbya aestuarii BL J]